MVGPLQFEIEGEVQLDRALSRFGDRIVDLSPFFRNVSDQLEGAIREQFETEGQRSGGWAPLSPRYAEWKEANYPGQPIMVLTGRLRESLVGGGESSIREVSRDQLKWGSSIEYGRKHQRGEGNLPQRRIIDLIESDRRMIMKTLQRHLVSGRRI